MQRIPHLTPSLGRLGAALSLAALVARAAAPGQASVLLQNATATYSQTGLPANYAIDGSVDVGTGWAIYNFSTSATTNQTLAVQTVSDLGFTRGTKLTFTLSQIYAYDNEALGAFRLSYTTDNRSTFADGNTGTITPGAVAANWVQLTPLSATSSSGATLAIQGDNSIQAGSPLNPRSSIYTIVADTAATGITGFRLEALSNSSLPTSGPGWAADGNFVLSEFALDAQAIPEPSALLLLALGGWLLRRRLAGPRS